VLDNVRNRIKCSSTPSALWNLAYILTRVALGSIHVQVLRTYINGLKYQIWRNVKL
jgi:hypothetical protein